MNPTSSTVFAAEDLVGLIGVGADVAAAERLIAGTPEPPGLPDSPALAPQAGEAEAAV